VSDSHITFAGVSRFYGEVLGINNVNLNIPPGITSLVGPNGSGKTTLMNLMTGLLRATRGEIRVLGIAPDQPQQIGRLLGYCTQFDAFPKGLTGFQFIYSYLLLYGMSPEEARERAVSALQKVNMMAAAGRPVAAYSKGMRQRVKLAQAIAHDPHVLVLDEPLNGLDPMARAETIALFREWGADGRHVIVSSHILHEVDSISDQVILLSHGYVWPKGRFRACAARSASSRCRSWCAATGRPSWPPACSSRTTWWRRRSRPMAATCCCAPRTPTLFTCY